MSSEFGDLGEIIAEVCTQGTNGGCYYLPKKDWDSYRENNLDKELDDLDSYNLKMEEYYIEENQKIIKCKDNEKRIKLYGKDLPYNIRNVWVTVPMTDFDTWTEDIMGTNICLSMPFCKICTCPMIINLFLAKLLGHKLYTEGDRIYIPVILFDLLEPYEYPIGAFFNEEFPFIIGLEKSDKPLDKENPKIEYLPIIEAKFNYRELTDFNNIPSEILFILQTNSCEKRLVTSIKNDKLFGVTKMIFFEFFDYEVDEPILLSVTMHLNSYKLNYNLDNGNIICSEVMGKTIYGLSLTPEFRSQDDMIKFFSSKRTVYNKKGINFSRLDQKRISFHFDREYTNLSVKITTLNYNTQFIWDGKSGIKYAN